MSNDNIRIKALSNGQKTYPSSQVCKAGHLGFRYTGSGACVDCAKLKAKIFNKKQYEKNKKPAELLFPDLMWRHHGRLFGNIDSDIPFHGDDINRVVEYVKSIEAIPFSASGQTMELFSSDPKRAYILWAAELREFIQSKNRKYISFIKALNQVRECGL